MKNENPTIVRCKQPIKIEKPSQCSRRFLTALMKEIKSPFSKQIMAENNEEFINFQSSQLEEEDLVFVWSLELVFEYYFLPYAKVTNIPHAHNSKVLF